MRNSWSEHDLPALVLAVVEDFVALRSLVQLHPVRDDDLWGQASLADSLQKLGHVLLDVRLSHLEGQPLVECVTEKKAVDETCIDAWHADDAPTARSGNALAQCFTTGPLQLERGQHRLGGAAFCLKPDCLDAGIHTATSSRADDSRRRILILVEVDRDDAVRRFGERESVRVVIDHEDRLGAQHPGTSRRHVADRAGTEDRNRRTLLDLAIDRGLIPGGEDVREEQHLLVGQGVGHDEGADIRLWNSNELSLTPRDAPKEVAITEESCRRLERLCVHCGAVTGVGCLARGVFAEEAMEALPTRDHERDNHAVSGFDGGNVAAHLFHDSHELVTKNVPVLHSGDLPAEDVEV